MKFTRVNLVEAIIFVLESCPNESFELKKLFNKVKKIIVFLPDEEVFKFQFVMTIKSLSKSKILNNVYRIHQYIISNKSYFSVEMLSNISSNLTNTLRDVQVYSRGVGVEFLPSIIFIINL